MTGVSFILIHVNFFNVNKIQSSFQSGSEISHKMHFQTTPFLIAISVLYKPIANHLLLIMKVGILYSLKLYCPRTTLTYTVSALQYGPTNPLRIFVQNPWWSICLRDSDTFLGILNRYCCFYRKLYIHSRLELILLSISIPKIGPRTTKWMIYKQIRVYRQWFPSNVIWCQINDVILRKLTQWCCKSDWGWR